MENGLLMPPTLAIQIEHAVRPARWRAKAIAEILARPCFAPLSRASYRRKDRWSGHKNASADVMESYLADPENHDLGLDNGRSGQLIVSATITTGVLQRTWTPGPPLLLSHILVPHDAALTADRMSATCELFEALEGASGAITVEPDHDLAQRFALGGNPKARAGLSEIHRKERKAHSLHDGDLPSRLSGPEWGLFLGPGHLATLSREKIEGSGAFATVRPVGTHALFITMTNDPADALGDGFEAMLDHARRVLAPLLMDVSTVILD